MLKIDFLDLKIVCYRKQQHMTYKKLKETLEKLTEAELNKSINFDISGYHGKIITLNTATENWYCTDWKYPFVDLMPESKHIQERQQEKKNWNSKDWEDYHEWYAYLTSVDPVFKKGDLYFQTIKGDKIRFDSEEPAADSFDF